MQIERRVLFLYPDLAQLDHPNFYKINKLIAAIDEIAAATNSAIDQIMCCGWFPSLKCKPSVIVKSVSDSTTYYQANKDVRICITKYNDEDYTSCYNQITQEYKNGDSPISHLVALHLFPADHKLNCLPDPDEKFDTIIEVDLDHLDILLEAIMLDTALYHIFSLSKDIQKRKDFNAIKCDYIRYKYIPDELPTYYGNDLSQNTPVYLPFSLKRMSEYSRRSREKSKNDTTRDLLYDYESFIVDGLSTELYYNENGALLINSEVPEFSTINNIVENNPTARKYISQKLPFLFIKFAAPSTGQTDPVVIQYTKDGHEFSNAAMSFDDDCGDYKIYKICEGK